MVVISNIFVTYCKSPIKVQNICETTNFLWTILIPNWGICYIIPNPFWECPNPLFFAPHPLFWGSKSPHFSSFFVFFYPSSGQEIVYKKVGSLINILHLYRWFTISYKYIWYDYQLQSYRIILYYRRVLQTFRCRKCWKFAGRQ